MQCEAIFRSEREFCMNYTQSSVLFMASLSCGCARLPYFLLCLCLAFENLSALCLTLNKTLSSFTCGHAACLCPLTPRCKWICKCVHGIPSRVYSQLMPSIPGIGSGYTFTIMAFGRRHYPEQRTFISFITVVAW